MERSGGRDGAGYRSGGYGRDGPGYRSSSRPGRDPGPLAKRPRRDWPDADTYDPQPRADPAANPAASSEPTLMTFKQFLATQVNSHSSHPRIGPTIRESAIACRLMFVGHTTLFMSK